RLGFYEFLLILEAHYGCFEHRLVADQRRLDLNRRDIDAAHFEHVVRAPTVGVVALRVEAVLVAATRPRALEGALGAAALAPVHDRRGRAADLQLAELARLGDDVALVVDQAHFV